MAPETYRALPADVREGIVDEVTLDPTLPVGQVDVHGEGGAVRMPVNDFVRQRRAARKAERSNRRRGRR